MTIVAISGKRRSGKSFLGDKLARQFGFAPISLAAPLKQKIREEFNLTVAQTDGDKKEDYDPRIGMTPRELMIKVGGFYRSLDKDFWVRRLFDQIKASPQAQLGKYVVTDMRFKNELDWFKRHGAILVRLERSERFTGPNINDPSENELDSFTEWDIYVPHHLNQDERDMDRTAELVVTRHAA